MLAGLSKCDSLRIPPCFWAKLGAELDVAKITPPATAAARNLPIMPADLPPVGARSDGTALSSFDGYHGSWSSDIRRPTNAFGVRTYIYKTAASEFVRHRLHWSYLASREWFKLPLPPRHSLHPTD